MPAALIRTPGWLIEMLLFLLKLVFLPYLCVAVTVEILTDPVTNEGQYSYVAGESNLTLKCRTYLDDVLQITTWSIMRQDIESELTDFVLSPTDGTIVLTPADLNDQLIISGSFIPDSETITYRTNFTIHNFTTMFDNSTVQCRLGQTVRAFVLGFPGFQYNSYNYI